MAVPSKLSSVVLLVLEDKCQTRFCQEPTVGHNPFTARRGTWGLL